MIPTEYREMFFAERALIARLLSPGFPGKDELVLQLDNALVRVIDEDGSLEFDLQSEIVANSVKYVFPTEGIYNDLDGVKAHVLLYMQNCRAIELEFYKEDGSRVSSLPEPDSVDVFSPM